MTRTEKREMREHQTMRLRAAALLVEVDPKYAGRELVWKLATGRLNINTEWGIMEYLNANTIGEAIETLQETTHIVIAEGAAGMQQILANKKVRAVLKPRTLKALATAAR